MKTDIVVSIEVPEGATHYEITVSVTHIAG